jgi:ABC-2 type transport system ATP-binding protein
MESVEQMCDHIALLHESNKILDGKLMDIKRQYKTNTFEVGLETKDRAKLESELNSRFNITPANFRTIGDELKLNIGLKNGETPNELLNYLTKKALVNHFVEVIPSANDIFIKAVKEN